MESRNCSPLTVKSEIDIVMEDIIRKAYSLQQETETHQEADLQITQHSASAFKNVQMAIKEELNFNADDPNNLSMENPNCPDENNLLVEKPTKRKQVNTIVKALNTSEDTSVNIKEERNEALISYDYPNFDDNVSIDSNEATALGNVEACLQEEVNIKCENDGDPQKDNQLVDVKIEPEVLPDTHVASDQIIPDALPGPVPKYSFVMKIPGDILSNIDHIVTSCLLKGTTYNDDTTIPNSEACVDNQNDVEMNDGVTAMNEESLNNSQTANLLQESDKSEPSQLDSFQLNSITGNILSLEQEAYAMIKKQKTRYSCPKCPKAYAVKHSLKAHLFVHQTIDNYANGRKKGLQTRKKNLKIKQKIEHQNVTKSEKTSIVQKGKEQDYKCTCGKNFKRRSRMETCLRSHDLFECNQNRFSCITCSKTFKGKDELALHRKRLHRKQFRCKFCPTAYNTRKKLFKHLQIHQKVHLMEYKVIQEVVKGKQKLQCFLCTKVYKELSELKTHVMTEHNVPYLCPHCKNTFPKIIDFGNHVKTYHPNVEGQSVLEVLEAFSKLIQEWKCKECDLQFLEADKFARHQIEKHSPELKGDPQFQCTDCLRVFISQKGLTSHRRIHHVEVVENMNVEEMGMMCLECRTMCKDMTTLTSHMKFHSLDRKYVCKFCDFRFATLEKRRLHAEIHTGEMKFVCFICEYQCSSENRLKKHKNSLKHANMKQYLLTGKPLIEESTSNDILKEKSSAKKKKKSKEENKPTSNCSNVESVEVSCDVCGEKFPSETEMLEHKQTHPFIEFPNEDTPSRIFFK